LQYNRHIKITFTDEHAFEDLYRHYFARLYRFCFSIVHVKEPAEEIIHDVFMNLWKKRDSLPEIDNLDVYLYVAVKNYSLNYLRDNHFLHTVDIEQHCSNYIQFHADPEALLVSTETVKAVLAVIDQLPPRCKLIFKLIKEDGLKQKDVAELLGLSIKTVEAQLGIALKKIAAALKLQETS